MIGAGEYRACFRGAVVLANESGNLQFENEAAALGVWDGQARGVLGWVAGDPVGAQGLALGINAPCTIGWQFTHLGQHAECEINAHFFVVFGTSDRNQLVVSEVGGSGGGKSLTFGTNRCFLHPVSRIRQR